MQAVLLQAHPPEGYRSPWPNTSRVVQAARLRQLQLDDETDTAALSVPNILPKSTSESPLAPPIFFWRVIFDLPAHTNPAASVDVLRRGGVVVSIKVGTPDAEWILNLSAGQSTI